MENSAAHSTTTTCTATISSLLQVHYDQRWASLGYLAIFIVAFQTLAMLAVAKCRHIRR